WREVFAEALGSVPYQVIWRYNDDVRPSLLGNNTMLLPWLPQVELLALARTKAFVTHCGMNAVYEAAQNGVPVVGIPLYGDQFYQANKVANHAV
ncbi:hypothetical protein P5F03_15280, partial [Clostridium perfringens]|nr:hypothetical protein [Clostridium perfringens]